MEYVGERELCFDQTELGFPSISGCHAIVYVTSTGLFGFHNLGGERPEYWPGMSGAFAKFNRDNVNGNGVGKIMYGVCYASDQRGYVGIKKTTWLNELTAFADAVGFHGQIWGYDLRTADYPGQAYVGFFHVQGKCVIQTRDWTRGEETKDVNQDKANHKTTRPAAPIYQILDVDRVITSIGATRPVTVYPEKLRG